jgi:serpin B
MILVVWSENALDTATRLVLTNAVHFEARWAAPCPPNDAMRAEFHREGGGTSEAMFMRQSMTLPYIEDEALQAVEFDYVGAQFALAVFLPGRSNTLRSFDRALSAERLGGLLGELASTRPSYVHVKLPRVHIAGEYSMIPALRAIGGRGGV